MHQESKQVEPALAARFVGTLASHASVPSCREVRTEWGRWPPGKHWTAEMRAALPLTWCAPASCRGVVWQSNQTSGCRTDFVMSGAIDAPTGRTMRGQLPGS